MAERTNPNCGPPTDSGVFTAEAAMELRERGYSVLERVLKQAQLDELCAVTATLFAQEGEQAGSEFRQEQGAARLANLVNKSQAYWPLIESPAVRPAVRAVLGDRWKLSSLNARTALAHNGMRQPLHCDMGALPDDQGFWVCNVVWLLDAFTTDNGALRVIPGSHRWGKLPQDTMVDPTANHPEECVVTAAAGSVIVLNAHTWHGGLANRSGRDRRALHAFYCRRDKPQQQIQRELLDEGLKAQLTDSLRDLLALDDPLEAPAQRRSGFLE